MPTGGGNASSVACEMVRICKLGRTLFTQPPDGGSKPTVLAVKVLVAGACASASEFFVSYSNKRMIQGLADASPSDFWAALRALSFHVCVDGILWVMFQHLQDELVRVCKTRLTVDLIQKYTSGSRFYHRALKEEHKQSGPGCVDQQITDDVSEFCRLALKFSLKIVRYLVRAVGFVAVLWGISPPLAGIAILYCASTTVGAQLLFGTRLLNLNDQRLTLAARLRVLLVRLRENAEGVALCHGGPAEQQRLVRSAEEASVMEAALLRCELWMGCLRNACGVAPQTLPLFYLAPQFFRKELNLGDLTQAVQAFAHVQETLSVVVNYFDELSVFRAVAARVHMLVEDLGQPALVTADTSGGKGVLPSLSACAVLRTPDDRAIVSLPDGLKLFRGWRVVVEGPSGCGKSTVIRSLREVWPFGSLAVTDPSTTDHSAYCLPQQSYLLPAGCSLCEQVRYALPEGAGEVTDECVDSSLAAAKLGYLSGRCGGLHAPVDLAATLSGGERQRLGWARLFVRLRSQQRPALILLDEPTASCDRNTAAGLFGYLREICAGDCCIVTVSHSAELRQWHTHRLSVDSGDDCSVAALQRL
eukprot:TRINITY_DN8224_c1_g1_i1.p1 TRINITY_DN8224_c1_g1~~TRINITY_DN8224_c1_g1_i1.p1  ORF type:complete len:609 (+),score=94.23 TRINITY_DN8224_c1_g1_i1:66-1829(+)